MVPTGSPRKREDRCFSAASQDVHGSPRLDGTRFTCAFCSSLIMIIMIIKGQKYLILLAIIANFPVGQSVSFTPETAINQEPAT